MRRCFFPATSLATALREKRFKQWAEDLKEARQEADFLASAVTTLSSPDAFDAIDPVDPGILIGKPESPAESEAVRAQRRALSEDAILRQHEAELALLDRNSQEFADLRLLRLEELHQLRVELGLDRAD